MLGTNLVHLAHQTTCISLSPCLRPPIWRSWGNIKQRSKVYRMPNITKPISPPNNTPRKANRSVVGFSSSSSPSCCVSAMRCRSFMLALRGYPSAMMPCSGVSCCCKRVRYWHQSVLRPTILVPTSFGQLGSPCAPQNGKYIFYTR